jgi:hypothetical protein
MMGGSYILTYERIQVNSLESSLSCDACIFANSVRCSVRTNSIN